MTRRRPEQQLQRAVIEHLRWRGVPGLWWCHYPAGGFRSAIEAAIFKSLGTTAGVPDLLLVYRGQLYGLELKNDNGRLSDTQAATHDAMKRAGAVVETAYGLDQALAHLITVGAVAPRRFQPGRKHLHRASRRCRKARGAHSPPNQSNRRHRS